MRDLKSKFVVVGDYIYMGKCVFHKDLIAEGDKPVGGGEFFFNKDDASFTFYGTSHDFGTATLAQITNAIQKGNVAERRRPTRYAAFNCYYCQELSQIQERKLIV